MRYVPSFLLLQSRNCFPLTLRVCFILLASFSTSRLTKSKRSRVDHVVARLSAHPGEECSLPADTEVALSGRFPPSASGEQRPPNYRTCRCRIRHDNHLSPIGINQVRETRLPNLVTQVSEWNARSGTMRGNIPTVGQGRIRDRPILSVGPDQQRDNVPPHLNRQLRETTRLAFQFSQSVSVSATTLSHDSKHSSACISFSVSSKGQQKPLCDPS